MMNFLEVNSLRVNRKRNGTWLVALVLNTLAFCLVALGLEAISEVSSAAALILAFIMGYGVAKFFKPLL